MKKAKSKREKDKEEQVLSVLLAGYAAKKTLQSIELASRLKSMYGAQDTLAKQSVPAQIPFKKGAPQA